MLHQRNIILLGSTSTQLIFRLHGFPGFPHARTRCAAASAPDQDLGFERGRVLGSQGYVVRVLRVSAANSRFLLYFSGVAVLSSFG